jgi:hypothetical protein
LIECRFLYKERKMFKNLLLLLFSVAVSSVAHATTFDFAAVADGDASYGAAAGEYGASSIIFTRDGISVTAAGASSLDDDAFQFAYLDSTWTHGGGGGEGGFGVCADLSGDQCTPSSDDNVTIGETLLLTFSQEVIITGITFRNGEHNPVFGEGAVFGLVVDGDTKADQILEFSYSQSWQGTSFEFINDNASDTDPFRFYMSALTVTAVPVPPAVWLFASGLLGLFGVARRRV